MSNRSTGHSDVPGWYEIRLTGRLDPRWDTWFDGMTLTADNDGTSLLRGRVVDQAALHGVLRKLRDIGLPLVSVTRVESTQPGTDRTTPPLARPDNSDYGD